MEAVYLLGEDGDEVLVRCVPDIQRQIVELIGEVGLEEMATYPIGKKKIIYICKYIYIMYLHQLHQNGTSLGPPPQGKKKKKEEEEVLRFSGFGDAADVSDVVFLEAGKIAAGLVWAEEDGRKDLLRLPSHFVPVFVVCFWSVSWCVCGFFRIEFVCSSETDCQSMGGPSALSTSSGMPWDMLQYSVRSGVKYRISYLNNNQEWAFLQVCPISNFQFPVRIHLHKYSDF
jgi:hypothetical protein